MLPLGPDEDSLAKVQSGPLPASLTALFLGNNGSKDANPPAWLARWQPQIVLLSAASADPRGPAAEVLVEMEGYTLLRTDLNGWIELTTGGEQMWVEVEKK